MKEVNNVKIEIVGKPKEIAALVLAVQERQSQVVNQLALSPVYNTSRTQNNTSQSNLTHKRVIEDSGEADSAVHSQSLSEFGAFVCVHQPNRRISDHKTLLPKSLLSNNRHSKANPFRQIKVTHHKRAYRQELQIQISVEHFFAEAPNQIPAMNLEQKRCQA